MSEKRRSSSCSSEEMELRKGPWTLEEDSLLIHYIAFHGEGRWNLLAKASGLKRTGKSCRLRWMNYLKPDIKKGNLTQEEQLLILELHSKLGNRWSRIAQHLPGRTDNEIKNYWRTRVQKQARQLRVDANSTVFRDAVRCYLKPRLLRLEKASSPPNSAHACTNIVAAVTDATAPEVTRDQQRQQLYHLPNRKDHHQLISSSTAAPGSIQPLDFESSSTSSCSDLLPQLFLPSRSSPDELSTVVAFSPFSSGYTDWDGQALVSATTALAAAADTGFDIDNGLWCMDELRDMFKSYSGSSGAQANCEVLSGGL